MNVTSIALALVPLLACLTACGQRTPVAAEQPPAGRIEITSAGVTWFIESNPDLPYDLFETTGVTLGPVFPTNVTMTNSTGVGSLDGREMRVSEGRVLIGEADFGAVEEGGRVEIRPDGVHVDGELRGPLR